MGVYVSEFVGAGMGLLVGVCVWEVVGRDARPPVCLSTSVHPSPHGGPTFEPTKIQHTCTRAMMTQRPAMYIPRST